MRPSVTQAVRTREFFDGLRHRWSTPEAKRVSEFWREVKEETGRKPGELFCMPLGLGIKQRAETYYPSPSSNFGSALAFWVYGGAGITTVSGAVSQWNDQSGSGDPNKNLLQGTAGSRPTFVAANTSFNSQPMLGFASVSDQYLRSGTWATALALPETIFIVGNFSGAAVNQYFSDGLTVNSRTTSNDVGANTDAIYNGTLLSHAITSGAAPQVFVGYFDSSTSSKLYSSAVTPIATGNAGTTAASRTGITVGVAGGPTAGTYLNGNLGEIFIISGAPTPTQLYAALQYCGSKYAIPIGP